jgi:hypothetical protein
MADVAFDNADVLPDQAKGVAASDPKRARDIARRLVSSWVEGPKVKMTAEDETHFERIMTETIPSLSKIGDKAGEVVPFDPEHHLEDKAVSTGKPVKVKRPGWTHGDRVILKAEVSPVGNAAEDTVDNAKYRGKLSGGRWVTTDDGHHIYIKGGKAVAGNPRVIKEFNKPGGSSGESGEKEPPPKTKTRRPDKAEAAGPPPAKAKEHPTEAGKPPAKTKPAHEPGKDERKAGADKDPHRVAGFSKEHIDEKIEEAHAEAVCKVGQGKGKCGEVSIALWDKLGNPKDLVPYGVSLSKTTDTPGSDHIVLMDKKTGKVVDPTGYQYDMPTYTDKDKTKFSDWRELPAQELDYLRKENLKAARMAGKMSLDEYRERLAKIEATPAKAAKAAKKK